jgi:hypothetical protein
MSTTVSRELTAEDVQQALTAALGPHYKVTVKSGSMLRVKRNATSWATVHISWSPGHTSFRVHGHGLVILRAIDAMTVTPKVRHALEHAFTEAA